MSSNNQTQSASDSKPSFDLSWDNFGTDAGTDDILGDVAAADVPKACSIDNPDCEACQ